MTPDVLVIGGGIAGAAAALAASAAGAATLLVRAGPGATALAAGGWTGEPPLPLQQALARAGLELVRCTGPLPHADGRLMHADCAPFSHAAAALPPDAAHRVTLVCGVDGLPCFRSSALAALWQDAAALPDGAMRATDVALPGTPAAGWAAVSIAAQVEREAERVADIIARATREQAADHVIVPAVLGLNEHARTYTALASHVSAACAATLGEALGAAPSLPGWRLDRALLGALEDAGVQVIAGRVARHNARDGRVHDVTVTRDDATITIAPRMIVLATGKFTGGGIVAASRFAEAVFGTDIAIARFGRSFRDADAALALTDPVRTEPQPVLGLGVATDVDSRLMSAAGDVVFDNVLVAGSVRAGVETASLGLGTAAMDGWTIGAQAVESASGGRAWA